MWYQMSVQMPNGKGHFLRGHAPAILTYLCIAPAVGECACPAHAAGECIRSRNELTRGGAENAGVENAGVENTGTKTYGKPSIQK